MTADVIATLKAVAADMRPLVQAIEAQPPTTQNHYGQYMAVLSRHAPNTAITMALCLCMAGANRDGVRQGYKAAFGVDLLDAA